jgi:hypothetical protein
MMPTHDAVAIPLPFLQGGWTRVCTDDAVYDIPDASLADAKKNEPNLRVLGVGVIHEEFQR